jgi:hypothetical protein
MEIKYDSIVEEITEEANLEGFYPGRTLESYFISIILFM